MRLRLTVLAAALVAAFAMLVPAASAGAPPAYLCNRATLGQTMFYDHKVWKCSVSIRFVGPYAYTTYYWLDLGYPA